MNFQVVFELNHQHGLEHRIVDSESCFPEQLGFSHRPMTYPQCARQYGEEAQSVWEESLRLVARDCLAYSWFEFKVYCCSPERALDMWNEALDRTYPWFPSMAPGLARVMISNIPNRSSQNWVPADEVLSIDISCQILDGTEFVYKVKYTATVGWLRWDLCVKLRYHSALVRLVHRECILRDDAVLLIHLVDDVAVASLRIGVVKLVASGPMLFGFI